MFLFRISLDSIGCLFILCAQQFLCCEFCLLCHLPSVDMMIFCCCFIVNINSRRLLKTMRWARRSRKCSPITWHHSKLVPTTPYRSRVIIIASTARLLELLVLFICLWAKQQTTAHQKKILRFFFKKIQTLFSCLRLTIDTPTSFIISKVIQS